MRLVERMLDRLEDDLRLLREVVHGATTAEIEHGEPPQPCTARRANRVWTIIGRMERRLRTISKQTDREAARGGWV